MLGSMASEQRAVVGLEPRASLIGIALGIESGARTPSA
jgi:hypothetical protein